MVVEEEEEDDVFVDDVLVVLFPASFSIPSFSDEEYKVLLKTIKEVANEGAKVRGVLITDELYYFVVFLVHSFLRPTESEVFAIRYGDIKIKDSPRRLEIKVSGKTGFRKRAVLN